MNITKLELCNRVSKKLGTEKTSTELKPILETFLDEIMQVLSENQRIEIRGFGSFRTKERRHRVGRNPRTGEIVDIPSYQAPVFKFSKEAQKIFDEKIGKVKKKEPAEKVAKPLGPVPAHTQAPKAPKEIKKKETTNAIESAEQFSPI